MKRKNEIEAAEQGDSYSPSDRDLSRANQRMHLHQIARELLMNDSFLSMAEALALAKIELNRKEEY